jgi:cysteine-rich repeat protein
MIGAKGALAAAGSARCGNGIVESGEECDSGDPLGSPGCDTLCKATELEPLGLPFGLPITPVTPEDEIAARIFSPGLECKPRDVRDGARDLPTARVRYRIHLCRNALGVDSFSETAVRQVLSNAQAEFARGGILLEEEALVRFDEPDCVVQMSDSGWSEALVDSTPPGVLSVTFVSSILSNAQFRVGGFCYFFGPICVNAGAYDSLVVHELGHFFGLAHTHECASGIETASTCEDNGDLFCDTPPDRGPLGVDGIARCEGGTMLDGSCSGTCGNKHCPDGSTPDGFNWMSYYHCKPGNFSDEQLDFMRCTLDHELDSYNVDSLTSTSTTSTTSTTLEHEDCGDVNEDGRLSATDALAVLRAGVGARTCEDWQCDYDGSGVISAADALAVLKAALGSGYPANCPERF